jgi:hypothetical protein
MWIQNTNLEDNAPQRHYRLDGVVDTSKIKMSGRTNQAQKRCRSSYQTLGLLAGQDILLPARCWRLPRGSPPSEPSSAV